MEIKIQILLSMCLIFLRYSLSGQYDGAYFEKFSFQEFQGRSAQTTSVSDDFQCLLSCKRLPECLSLNIADQPSKDGLYECVLLRNATSESTGLLTPSHLYHHHTRRFLCASPGMCKNGGTCVPLVGDFQCHCLQFFTGKQCENVTCNATSPLGMENGTIPDSSITAFSYIRYYSPKEARLKAKNEWSPEYNDINQWLQVDLSTVTMVTHIATQGSNGLNEWVTSYSLQYGLDDKSFEDYQRGKIFTGNNDQNTIVKHVLNPAIIARYIRVRPITWYCRISLRMELYGCR